ncbi:MAG: AMP-binding protein [Spirochaetales bacterium]|nr:AMP-binding protein [Spirochaetales bacterium]
MELFYVDEQNSEIITWNNFIDQINTTKIYNRFCYNSSIYSVLKHITISIIYNKPIILLDGDFTIDEIENLTGEREFSRFEEKLNQKLIKDKNELIKILQHESFDKWSLTLFTSGTTGLPKKVTHSYRSITRNVKTSEIHKNDIWGYAYNPTHMAGIQVFLQAIINGNMLVRLFNIIPSLLFSSIEKYSVTNISATPSFYKTFLMSNMTFPSVKVITSGGERFNESLSLQLKKIFPNARFKNIYALTEAGPLFTSTGDIFTVENTEMIKIEDNRLYLHHSLLGNFNFDDEWYDTGDIVEIVGNNPLQIRFLTREKELINVGGYKVNPHEVEQVLLQLDEVNDAVVYSKTNSVIGNIIVADVILSKPITEVQIRKFLSSKIQEYKIPRIIRFVDKIELSRTGKIKRI